jgi:hypothetical protein
VIVVIVVVEAVLPGITGSGGSVVASAPDHAFGGNWKVDSSRSATVTISGNTATIAYLNGTSTTVPVSQLTQSSPLGSPILSGINQNIQLHFG